MKPFVAAAIEGSLQVPPGAGPVQTTAGAAALKVPAGAGPAQTTAAAGAAPKPVPAPLLGHGHTAVKLGVVLLEGGGTKVKGPTETTGDGAEVGVGAGGGAARGQRGSCNAPTTGGAGCACVELPCRVPGSNGRWSNNRTSTEPCFASVGTASGLLGRPKAAAREGGRTGGGWNSIPSGAKFGGTVIGEAGVRMELLRGLP